MPLTAAERSKRWRDKQKECPEKHTNYLYQEKQRYTKRKSEGKIQPISNLNERGKRSIRRSWKKNQQNKRKNDTIQKTALQNALTPPGSPNENENENEISQRQLLARQRGKKTVRRDRAKVYRDLNLLKVKLTSTSNLAERYKKRYNRLKKREQLTEENAQTKVDQLLNGKRTITKEIKKTLLLHHTLVGEIKKKYNSTASAKKRQIIAGVVRAKIYKKYRLQNSMYKEFEMRPRVSKHQGPDARRKPRKDKTSSQLQERVKQFLSRDDNSRMTPGKKETITRHKIKKQKRILNDDLKTLHSKFQSENGNRTKMSLSLFQRMRPFWIVKPSAKDRETCLCKKHENIELQMTKLHQLKVINASNLDSILTIVCCKTDNKDCMYGDCSECKSKKVPACTDVDFGRQTCWYKWKTRRVEKTKKSPQENPNSNSTVTMTIKDKEEGTCQQLYDEFNDSLLPIRKHIYNIRHQYKALQTLREGLLDNEIIIHMDFSENYSCKYAKEIQSIHFGASQVQVTLHTGLVYWGRDVLFSFCTTSDYNKHHPAAIWAHTKHVLQRVQSICPAVDTVYFVSDGPTTQYRNKQNFYLLCTLFYDWGFKSANWNFLEAGHGKGPADGIGAVIKRSADAAVLNGADITNASSLCEALTTTVNLSIVTEEEVLDIEKTLPADLRPIPETMKIHQVIYC